METQKNIDEVIDGWARVVLDRFKEAMTEYQVHEYSSKLINSLAYELVRANGNVEKVILKFQQYGRFVDMGVGRGVPKGGRGTAAFEKSRKENGKLVHYGRQPKLWYSKTKTREIAILRTILVRDYGINTLADIEAGLMKTEIINVA